MSDLFNGKGPCGEQLVNIKMNELYKIVHDRLEYTDGGKLQERVDIDAITQQVCYEVERKMGLHPEHETSVKPKPSEWPKDHNGKNLPDPSEGGNYSF